MSRSYSDYPDFMVRVESLEEIFALKLRALVERKKVRDYYDTWKMSELEVDRAEISLLLHQKLRVRGREWHGLQDVFPPDLRAILAGYWEKELGRLVWPVPRMADVIGELKGRLNWLGCRTCERLRASKGQGYSANTSRKAVTQSSAFRTLIRAGCFLKLSGEAVP